MIPFVLACALGAGTAIGFVVARSAWPRRIDAPALPASTVRVEVRRRSGLRSVLHTLRHRAPEAETSYALALAIALAVVGAVAAGLLAVMIRTHLGFARWDLSAARFGASHASASTTTLLRRVTFIGGTEGSILLALVSLGALRLFEGRTFPTKRALSFLTVVFAGHTIIVNLTKVIVGRTRPDIDRLTHFAGSSFPSGHAANAAATLAAIALLIGRGRSPLFRQGLFALAVGLTATVAASRVLLGVHWLTDVLAGAAIGWMWFAIASIAFGGRLLRYGAPAVVADAAAGTAKADEDRHTSPV